MLSAHETCPICNKPLLFAKYINKDSGIMKKKFSWAEGICNKGIDNYQHVFFQISSLYGERLFEKISFAAKSCEIEVNYVDHYSQINYWPKVNQDIHNASSSIPESVRIDNKLVDLDYPLLEKATNKIKTLALFL
jgi:hypothetical protein